VKYNKFAQLQVKQVAQQLMDVNLCKGLQTLHMDLNIIYLLQMEK